LANESKPTFSQVNHVKITLLFESLFSGYVLKNLGTGFETLANAKSVENAGNIRVGILKAQQPEIDLCVDRKACGQFNQSQSFTRKIYASILQIPF